ncbi:homeobox protein 5 isoform X2 [Sitodiplosis mosellana]|uniref:homeobox protein 5 isoform X2 n=1 Tax=Sitodiplosis mosellana TaxID=263140 RepID=UPI0024446A15|nr:homeobox protein 5 isoform X2 [Sitodiplosis mosellana]
MMSTGENVKFRSTPNQEIARPLSTYDNLNNEPKMNGTTACKNEAIERSEHVNEFPFSGISFRFDELKQPNQNTTPTIHSSNGYDNINNNNYKLHRNNNQNVNNSPQFNGNDVNQIRSNQVHTVTTIAQNHSSSSSSSSSTTSSSSSSSSSENSYKHSSQHYANLAGNPIANRGNNKPVHSVAKSQFLGLHKTSDDNEPNITIESRTNGGATKQSLEKNSQDERDNTGESSTVSEEEPLLNSYGGRIATNGLNRTPNSTQYQNVPSNSSCYGQNQIDDANECTCMCKEDSDPGTEIRQYESDRYKCNGCLNRNSGGAPISVIPISSMNVPTCSKTVDLASCATSMKPAKPTTLDTSSSFRLNQSPLSQAVYMSTTVPQNIKGCNIMGSHLPTRNSLRHSRMLVVVRRRNPLNIRHPNSVKYLFNFHVLIGLAVSCLGLWLCWWAPSTSARDNPYWSGLILMLSGILGIIVLAFKPRPRQKPLRQHFITFLRINSTLVTFIAAVCTFVASSFAIFHLTNIAIADCRPVNILVESSACTCRFDGISTNGTVAGIPKADAEIFNGSYYRDLSCNEVMGPFKYILIASAILNFIGFLLCFTLLILLCMRQKPVKRVPYSSASSRHRL